MKIHIVLARSFYTPAYGIRDARIDCVFLNLAQAKEYVREKNKNMNSHQRVICTKTVKE